MSSSVLGAVTTAVFRSYWKKVTKAVMPKEIWYKFKWGVKE